MALSIVHGTGRRTLRLRQRGRLRSVTQRAKVRGRVSYGALDGSSREPYVLWNRHANFRPFVVERQNHTMRTEPLSSDYKKLQDHDQVGG